MATRLARATLHPVRIPYRRAVRWSDTAEDAATNILLRLVDDAGHEGVGEATVKPTWSGTSMRTITAAVEDLLLPLLANIDLADTAEIRRRFARIPENQQAKALVDNALCDLRAHAEATTSRSPGSIEVSWTITRDTPAAMASDAADAVARHGFRTLKVKGGQGADVDAHILREVRAAVGDAVRLYVDANGAYAAEVALDYVRMLRDFGVEIVEDPCLFAPDACFAALQAATPSTLLVDFQCASPRDARLFTERGARALSVKPSRAGASDCREMVEVARAAGCAVHVGLFGESDLGSLATLRLAATLGGAALPAEPTLFLLMAESLLTAPLVVADGRVVLPPIERVSERVDWARVARLQIG